jgi:hypothetical protein
VLKSLSFAYKIKLLFTIDFARGGVAELDISYMDIVSLKTSQEFAPRAVSCRLFQKKTWMRKRNHNTLSIENGTATILLGNVRIHSLSECFLIENINLQII